MAAHTTSQPIRAGGNVHQPGVIDVAQGKFEAEGEVFPHALQVGQIVRVVIV